LKLKGAELPIWVAVDALRGIRLTRILRHGTPSEFTDDFACQEPAALNLLVYQVKPSAIEQHSESNNREAQTPDSYYEKPKLKLPFVVCDQGG
jgi:hypothetical protein